MEYVCSGATLKCTMGTSTSKLKATPKNVTLMGQDQANIADYVSITNIPGFGKCRSLVYPPTASATAANHGKLTPMPCVPGTCPKWKVIDKESLGFIGIIYTEMCVWRNNIYCGTWAE